MLIRWVEKGWAVSYVSQEVPAAILANVQTSSFFIILASVRLYVEHEMCWNCMIFESVSALLPTADTACIPL